MVLFDASEADDQPSEGLGSEARILLGLYWTASIVGLAWAGVADLYAMLAAACYLFVRRGQGSFDKATAAFALSLSIGLGIVAFFVAVLNIGLATDNAPDSRTISALEDTVHTWAHALSYLKLGWWDLSIMLTLLYLLTLRHAAWRPVTRFMKLKTIAGRVAAVATVVSSFTVFATSPVIGQLGSTADRQIEAVYSQSRRREGEALRLALAAKVVSRAMATSDRVRIFLGATVNQIAAVDLKKQRSEFARYLADRITTGVDAPLYFPADERGVLEDLQDRLSIPWELTDERGVQQILERRRARLKTLFAPGGSTAQRRTDPVLPKVPEATGPWIADQLTKEDAAVALAGH
jgi:hypothetical protein